MEKNNRKICLIANAAFAVVNFRSELIKRLVEMGSSIIVICPAECSLMMGRNLGAELESLGAVHVPVAFSRSGINPISEIRFLITLFRVLRNEKPDVVLNYTIVGAGSIVTKNVEIFL